MVYGNSKTSKTCRKHTTCFKWLLETGIWCKQNENILLFLSKGILVFYGEGKICYLLFSNVEDVNVNAVVFLMLTFWEKDFKMFLGLKVNFFNFIKYSFGQFRHISANLSKLT